MRRRNTLLPLLLLMGIALNAQIKRVEPPFWWANRAEPQLSLLLYGEQLGTYTPKLSTAIPFSIEVPSNTNYIFLHLDLKGIQPQQFTIQLTHPSRKTLTYDYTIHVPPTHQPKGFDSSDVVYLIMPDRFANGNPENDAHPSMREKPNRKDQDGRHGGDLQGVMDHLDYLDSLGVTTLWLTPVCADDDPQVSYHTYAQSDLYQIDPRYGTNADYRQLADALHQRGMKLIKDYVTNHWAQHHWMVLDPPEPEIVHHFEKYTETNHRKEIYSDPYRADADLKQMESGWFVPSMVDLNQSHPLLQTYLIQNTLWWITYAGLDGLRVDTYPYNDPLAMQAWVNALRKQYPTLTIVGESWVDTPVDVAYWQANSPVAKIAQHQTSLPAVMDFPLKNALLTGFQQNNRTWHGGVDLLYRTLQKDFLYADPHLLLLFLENHDTERINALFPDIRDYKRLLKVLCTVRGIPQLYYGTEIGMQGDKSKGDGDIRRDFPGGWPQDSQNAFVASKQTATQKMYFDFTQQLLQWRKKQPAIHHGKTLHYVPKNDLYVYFRYNATQRIMVVVNNHKNPQTLEWSNFDQGVGNARHATEALTRKVHTTDSPLQIKGKTTLILELN